MDELQNSLKPLAKLLEKQEPKVLALVGTGVSIGATSTARASWLGLLEHGVNYLVETGKFTIEYGADLKADINAAFSPFDLDKALEHAENVQRTLSLLKPKEFTQWLYNSFSGLKAQVGRTDTLDAIRDLQQSGALIVTTNYDSLLSDITGLPPVTWDEPNEFLNAINNRDRILHIHGHWKRPSSIILGRSSYDRIVADKYFQSAFEGLWLFWSWIYVGCGDGLDDPNLGNLLRWGKGWGDGALPHYFLAKTDKAVAIESRPDKPNNLVSVPYEEYSDLPNVLRSVTPTVRCSPFIIVDEKFRLFRDPHASPLAPFPSRQEFLDEKVPKLTIDGEVVKRLHEQSWAFVLDVASVGKTTLALRIATSKEQRNYPVFYLDLAHIGIEDFGDEAVTALKRLSRQNILLILDNGHHQPELVRKLWDQWRNNSSGSRLLIIATKTQQHIKTSPDQDLIFFEKVSDNPAVELRPTEIDLENILNHIYFRILESHSTKSKHSFLTKLKPPSSALKLWYKNYGNALGAFCLAVLNHLYKFKNGDWGLPLTAASDWVKKEWLEKLDVEYIENLICLSVFGTQELELNIYEEALPYPSKTKLLLEKGLVFRINFGKFGQDRMYALREPSWGSLVLAAQDPQINVDKVLFICASRDVRMATLLSWRLRYKKTTKHFENLWLFISQNPESLLKVYERPISFSTLTAFAKYGASGKQPSFMDSFWEVVKSNPEKFAERAWETSLEHVGSFLELAQKSGQDTNKLWEALESNSQKLSERVQEISIEKVGSFLEVAKRQRRDTSKLWDAMESDLQNLVERVWETSLEKVRSFLNVAKEHGRDTSKLWTRIESYPQKLAERAWETSLEHAGAFLEIAEEHGREVDKFWDAIESNPQKLAERAWETSLEKVGSFLDTAKKHGRDTSKLWSVIESNPEKLSAKAKIISIAQLSGFATRAPDSVVKIALKDIQPIHWSLISADESLMGYRGLAIRCEEVGRNDLKSAIVSILLRRANWRDFPLGSLPSVVWVLNNRSVGEDKLIQTFLNGICTNKWLGYQYSQANCNSLANGFYMLAISQPLEFRKNFYNYGIEARIAKEFSRFSSLQPQEQSDVVQLLGCAVLSGWHVKSDILHDASLEVIYNLPLNVLNHRADTANVEEWQFRLWLGLRAVASITNNPLPVSAIVINQTLNLWRKNFEESSLKPESAEHYVNGNMVSWLEECLRKNKGLLPAPLLKSR